MIYSRQNLYLDSGQHTGACLRTHIPARHNQVCLFSIIKSSKHEILCQKSYNLNFSLGIVCKSREAINAKISK